MLREVARIMMLARVPSLARVRPLNPRDSMFCEVCMGYYNGTSMTERISDPMDKTKWRDCFHGTDIPITRELFFIHARQVRGRL